MGGSKYFDAVLDAIAHPSPEPDEGLPPFDFNMLARKGLKARLSGALSDALLPLLLRFGRAFAPVLRAGGVYWVSRDSDVRTALADPATFRVPYGPEMADLSGGSAAPPDAPEPPRDGEINFVLGMDGPDQARQNAIIRKVIRPRDLDLVATWARAFAQSLIDGGRGRLDVVSDLAIRVPTEICRRYFGLSFADPQAFAEWAISVSALLFADPFGDGKTRALASSGARRLRFVIDAAIARARAELASPKSRSADLDRCTLVERLVLLAAAEPELGLSDKEIRAILLGLVVGFIPTNGLAAAKMIEALLARPNALAQAKAAAQANDVTRMEVILLEAGRLNPALAPGQWRYTAIGGVIGEGRRRRVVPPGSTLMIATASAMRDRRAWRRPGRFDATRAKRPDLIFGHGVHSCLGEQLAVRIIRELFVVLFAQPNLRRVKGRRGRMQRVGYFPHRLEMTYDSPAASQSMAIVAIPIESGEVADAVRAEVESWCNPARPDIAAALDATGIVHFASCSVIESGDAKRERHHFLLELNVDGPPDAAIDAAAAALKPWLAPVLAQLLPTDERSVAELLRAHLLKLRFWPWGAIGLNFFGTGEFPVAAIERHAALHKLVRAKLDENLASKGGFEGRALTAMTAVRRAIHWASRADPRDPDLLALDASLVQPRGSGVLFSQRRPEAQSFWSPAAQVLRNGLGRQLAATGLVSWFVALILCHHAFAQSSWLSLPELWGDVRAFASVLLAPDFGAAIAMAGRGALLVLLALCATGLFWGGLAFALYRRFLAVEAKEVPDDRAADAGRMAAIARREDSPTHAQNHILSVTPLKPGLMRRLSLALALWGIRQSLFWFRPGFVVTMGTIHYAKWFRLPDANRLIFQSNYDGSWESYLEDFITRAHSGQTAAWSNGVGFPRSRRLVDEGAKDGDRFKRWVRRQQVPTAFWYSRFPGLTTGEIRRNALVHDGLARARTDTAARAWLDLLGSAPRRDYELETQEIQGIVFRGLGRARHTACIPLRLPRGAASASRWLDVVRKGEPGKRPGLSFGNFPEGGRALYLGLSPTGLARFNQDRRGERGAVDLVAKFPYAFAAGMANRRKILGDPARPDLWSDSPRSDGVDGAVADAVLLLYAPDTDTLERDVAAQRRLLEREGGRVVHDIIRTVLLDEGGKVQNGAVSERTWASYEHFGFRDGISQPVIRGAEQFTPGFEAEDVVEPGEFILGYRNNQGYFTPCVGVPADSDAGETLPVAPEGMPFGQADFSETDEQFAIRDFGRNGSFLVIRQLEQKVDAFRRFTEEQADEVNRRYGAEAVRRTVGERVGPDWIAAKLMGRWRDGRPLIGNPRLAEGVERRRPENGFSYGRDDPRGHQCPLGSHIRRTNPRDSLEPADPLERSITNRHRLLRRGRSYIYDRARAQYVTDDGSGDVARGLLFVALCADLERQFEFVQQSWLRLPSFHGLSGEPDPVSDSSEQPDARGYTIPTAAGPISLTGLSPFVTYRGGGYFFLPSRSAIRYLVNFQEPLARRRSEWLRKLATGSGSAWSEPLPAKGARGARAGAGESRVFRVERRACDAERRLEPLRPLGRGEGHPVDEAEAETRLGVTQALERGGGAGRAAAADQRVHLHDMRVPISRAPHQRLIGRLHRRLPLAEHRARHRELAQGIIAVLLAEPEAEGLGQELDRRLGRAAQIMGRAELRIGIGEARIELDRLVQQRDRRVRVAHPQLRRAGDQIAPGVERIGGDRPLRKPPQLRHFRRRAAPDPHLTLAELGELDDRLGRLRVAGERLADERFRPPRPFGRIVIVVPARPPEQIGDAEIGRRPADRARHLGLVDARGEHADDFGEHRVEQASGRIGGKRSAIGPDHLAAFRVGEARAELERAGGAAQAAVPDIARAQRRSDLAERRVLR